MYRVHKSVAAAWFSQSSQRVHHWSIGEIQWQTWGIMGRLGWATVKITSLPGMIKGIVEHCVCVWGGSWGWVPCSFNEANEGIIDSYYFPLWNGSFTQRQRGSEWLGWEAYRSQMTFFNFNCIYLHVQIYKHECGHACGPWRPKESFGSPGAELQVVVSH